MSEFENDRVMIIRDDKGTRLWIAYTPGTFKGFANYAWPDRQLTDNQCKELLENPWRIFEKRNSTP